VPTNPATTQAAADAAAPAKIAGQAAAGTASAAPQVAPTGPTATTNAALTVAVEAPVTPGAKTATGTKTATPTPAATSPSAKADATATASAEVGNNALAQPATPDQANAGDVTKADAASITPSAPAPAAAGHSSNPATEQPAPAPVDASAQAVTVLPQQLPLTAAPISTANLTATPATGAAVPLSGLAVQIAATVRSGKTQFEVRLDPADLGRIDVRIQIDSNGQVTSHLTVEKPETLTMLQQDAPQLQQALNDAGLKTGSGGLQFSLRDQSSSSQNSGGQTYNGNPQRLIISEDNTASATTAGRSYGRMLGANGGVDITV
jgi:flagellar hook-length control protein FliK